MGISYDVIKSFLIWNVIAEKKRFEIAFENNDSFRQIIAPLFASKTTNKGFP